MTRQAARGRWAFVGIDPGLHGALALLYTPTDVVGVWDLPTRVVPRDDEERERRVLNADAIVSLMLQEITRYPIALVVIEQSVGMPKQSSASTYKQAYSCGLLEGIMRAHRLNIELVPSAVWKRQLLGPVGVRARRGKSGKHRKVDLKRLSLGEARTRFPQVAATHLVRAKDEGRAEALWLAEYARQYWRTIHQMDPTA
jgi:hypothetical protein